MIVNCELKDESFPRLWSEALVASFAYNTLLLSA
jgi:hypothetical protein